ncbi:type II toxin-antitoxin system VapC family toxin [Methylobacterium haplocladii]|uniref:type II toxin-antitoxin system VapC family toxin n=1 Tax=Methylobacterium haplocladii TaxID=1176176 RepID=UPI001AEDB9FF|nr:type II toxin-antitoxin system VapC family toxin [Methylobacterium haplocladii]
MAIIDDPAIALVFSVVSIWEVAIKRGLGRANFRTDSRVLRRALLDNGYEELTVLGAHAVAVEGLPPIHKDPFDRLLIAQATVEGITLATADATIATYPGPIRLV